MRIRTFVMLAAIALVLHGCEGAYTVFHGEIPTSVKLEKLDMTGAAALAVMQCPVSSSPTTRADDVAYGDRFFILDKDGNAKLASFTIKEEGSSNNKVWKKVKETINLIPQSIVPLSESWILLSNVGYSLDWRLDEETSGRDELFTICSLLDSMNGAYFLRVSDGALFKGPFNIEPTDPDIPVTAAGLNGLLKFTSDRKHMVVFHVEPQNLYGARFVVDYWWGLEFGNVLVNTPEGPVESAPDGIMPWVFTDKGNAIEHKMPSEPIADIGLTVGFILTKDSKIITLATGKGCKGTWSFDLDLKPVYLDYSETLQNVLGIDKNYGRISVYEYNSDTYLIKGENRLIDGLDKYCWVVYKVILGASSLDCSLLCYAPAQSKVDFAGFPGKECKMALTDNGFIVLTTGSKIILDLKNASIITESIPESFPQEWKDYNENGIAYRMSDDNAIIYQYDINHKKMTEIPIHWEQVSFGTLVSSTTTFSNGVFIVSGRNRDAQSVTALIDPETGNVTSTDLSDYSSPIIRTYYRLN